MLEINIKVTGIDGRHAALLTALLYNFFNTHAPEYGDADYAGSFAAGYYGSPLELHDVTTHDGPTQAVCNSLELERHG